MREILYRGKPKSKYDYHFFSQSWKDNCRDGFVYGSLVVNKNRDLGDRYYICVTALCSINSCVNNGMTSMIEVVPETVGEYTTLNDKNGRMIFEGDIVKHMQDDILINHGIVNWDKKNARWAYHTNVMNECFAFYTPKAFEVIGNIHDNPELLRGDKNEYIYGE